MQAIKQGNKPIAKTIFWLIYVISFAIYIHFLHIVAVLWVKKCLRSKYDCTDNNYSPNIDPQILKSYNLRPHWQNVHVKQPLNVVHLFPIRI